MRKLRMMRIATVAGASAAATYLFDPQLGRGRRARLRDQLAARSRRAERKVEQQKRFAEGQRAGLEARRHGKGVPHPTDDRTVRDLISAELHRLAFPTNAVVVDVVDGEATLRGELQHPDEIRDVRDCVSSVPGVAMVHSYLHLPGSPPPNKADSLNVDVRDRSPSVVN